MMMTIMMFFFGSDDEYGDCDKYDNDGNNVGYNNDNTIFHFNSLVSLHYLFFI
jgi:hypothetical protein